jgi:cytochrome c nitrite reductase small subunit
MDKGETRRKRMYLLTAVLGGALFIALFLAFGPPKLLAKSEQPNFCNGCHSMEAEYEAWAHAGAHRRKLCVDCHLPNDNAGIHYVWKGIDGMKDVLTFYTGMVPEKIRLTAHGEKVVQENCIRCHETTVMNINPERRCWDCHRRIAHTRSGAMQTL